MDSYSNILKNITGKVQDKYETLSKSCSAKNSSIKINTDCSVKDLNNLCKDLLTIYHKDDCRQNFPEAFHIQATKDSSLIDKLNDELLSSVNNKKKDVYLEIPDLIDFNQVDRYQINVKDRKKHYYEDISISNFYETIQSKNAITVEGLKKWQLVTMNQNGIKIQSFPLFECLVFECTSDNKEYHLSHGQWYSLDSDFSKKLQEINKNKKDTINGLCIPSYIGDNEGDYNKKLADHLSAACLDKKCIPMGGYDKIELCDVLCISEGNENIFIHVKIKHGGSSSLSHLFEQGDVSVTLLNTKDQTFIDGIIKKFPDFDAEKAQVVHYLIIGDPLRELPLFARVCLFKKIESIKSKGATAYWSIVPNTIKRVMSRPATHETMRLPESVTDDVPLE